MSHVIAGLCGGIHRPEPTVRFQLGPIDIPGQNAMARRTLELDPLYAVTIAGDLGQASALGGVAIGSRWGGVGPEATSPELTGDIDGFLLGNWLSTTTAGQQVRTQLVQGSNVRLSRILSEYYRIEPKPILNMRAGSGNTLEAIRRFSNFNTSLQFITDELFAQTQGFHHWYALTDGYRGERREDVMLTNQAVADFIRWCDRGGK
jgi:hypothetical protein